MSKKDRLLIRTKELESRWRRISDKIAEFHKYRDLETRVEEKSRLKLLIDECEAECATVDEKIDDTKERIEKLDLVQKALSMERNGSYNKAMGAWRKLRRLEPDNARPDEEIERLEKKRDRAGKMDDTLKKLSRHFIEIQSIWPQITNRLKKSAEEEVEDNIFPPMVENFLAGKLPADEFTTMWKKCETSHIPAPPAAVDFSSLCARLKRGELILFLGSDIPHQFHENVIQPEGLVAGLAKNALYDNFAGSLSMLAEYYEMKQEYGVTTLVRKLHAILPDSGLAIPLYDLLARIEQPLTIMCVYYDTLLEEAFKRNGKKFAIISALLGDAGDHNARKILVKRSDKEKAEPLCIEEHLSQLSLLDKGYSLIYRVRGICEADMTLDMLEFKTLTLTEKNHFFLARHTDKLVPSYISNQFPDRGFLFLGFSPRNWEDRLIVNAILDQRKNAIETPTAVRRETDKFETAFWRSRNVRKYDYELKDFVEKLEEVF